MQFFKSDIPDSVRPPSADAGTIRFARPVDGVVIAQIEDAGGETVDMVVQAARAAYVANRKLPLAERLAWLRGAAERLRANASELAAIISEHVGKPIKAARFETERGADFLENCASAASQLGGETFPLDSYRAGAGLKGMTMRKPFGVVAGITPFNAPVNLLLQKVAPALAMGNAIVVKPAISGTKVALRLAELFRDAGLPDGMFCVVTGDKAAAIALVSHPDVAAVSFTGGTDAGNDLIRAAGAKKFVAELGSNAANLVFEDADLELAASRIAVAGFEASGQQCISAQRVLVHRSILDRFVPKLVAAASKLTVGDPADPKTDIGPMVHRSSALRVMAMVEDALSHGATIALEPIIDNAVVSPGILIDVPRAARLWREEVFGPILIVVPFEDVEQALELANDSIFGLQGAVFTASLSTAFRVADDFEVGSLWINEASRFRLDSYPFGGVKQSGIGREGIRFALEELSQLKFVGFRT